jgi:hypothetical protein
VEATTLPTYEEAERSKLEEAHNSEEGVSDSTLESGHGGDIFMDMTIGTDSMFICTFLSKCNKVVKLAYNVNPVCKVLTEVELPHS